MKIKLNEITEEGIAIREKKVLKISMLIILLIISFAYILNYFFSSLITFLIFNESLLIATAIFSIKTISIVEGWLTNKEGEFLYNQAKACSKGVVVEIGSWKGKSTICLGKGSQDGYDTKVYAIDPHKGTSEHLREYGDNIWTFPVFLENIKEAGVSDTIKPMVMTSEEAEKGFNKPIELLFIDGDHSYKSVKEDFLLWYPHVIEGGMIILHDTTGSLNPLMYGRMGCWKVANEFIFKSSDFKKIGITRTMTHVVKCKSNSFYDRGRNTIIRMLKYIPDLLSVLIWIGAKIRRRRKNDINT